MRNPASSFTRDANAAVAARLPLDDPTDGERNARGLLVNRVTVLLGSLRSPKKRAFAVHVCTHAGT